MNNNNITDLNTTKRSKLKLCWREDNKKHSKTIDYDWYFYVTLADFRTHKSGLQRYLEHGIRYVKDDETWVKIYCNYPAKNDVISYMKQIGLTTYEADLSLVRRYWIDSNYHVALPEHFKILYFDIEVDDSISGLRIGADPILSIAGADNDGNIHFFSKIPEKEILQKFNELSNKYDIIIGWNSRNYDMPFIEKRCELHNIKLNNICHIDMMQRMIHAYRFDTNIKSFSLDAIANHFLKEGKIERKERIIEMYKNDFEKFKKYNIKDCTLMKRLDDEFNIIQMLLKQIYWCNVTPRSLGQGGGGLYTLLDTLLLKEAHKRNIKGPSPKYTFDELKSMTKEQQEDIDYPGGLVLDAKVGLYKNVYIFDFKTMYPSIILSSNIGFETLNKEGDIKNPSGANFDSKPQSIMVSVLNELLTKRKTYKEHKLQLIEDGKKGTPEYGAVEADEVVVKELGNSVYGIMGAKWGRYFAHRKVVESITLMGQWLLRSMDDFFSKCGYTILTGDTDSIMIATDKDVDTEKILKEYHKYLKKRLLNECNIKKSYIQLDFDKYFKKFLIVAKKNYAGHITNQEGHVVDYVFVRGMSSVKSDTCKIASNINKELLNLILLEEHDTDFFKDWIHKTRKHIFDKISVDDISIHKKIRGNINTYKSKPLSVEIASRYANKEGFIMFSEIDYVVTGREKVKTQITDENGKIKNKTTNKLKGVSVQDYVGCFDKEYYWNNLVFPNISRLLEVIYPDTAWHAFNWKDEIAPRLFY